MTLPVLLLTAGLIGSIVMYIRHRKVAITALNKPFRVTHQKRHYLKVKIMAFFYVLFDAVTHVQLFIFLSPILLRYL